MRMRIRAVPGAGVDDVTISLPVSVNQISGIYKFQLPALFDGQMVVSADLEFYCNLHPDKSEPIASAIIEEHSKTGKPVQTILLEKMPRSEAIRALVQHRTEAAAKELGGTVSYPETPAVQPVVGGTPAPVTPAPAGAPAQQVVAAPQPPASPGQTPPVAAPVVPVGGASTTPATPPQSVNDQSAAEQKVAAMEAEIDAALEMPPST